MNPIQNNSTQSSVEFNNTSSTLASNLSDIVPTTSPPILDPAATNLMKICFEKGNFENIFSFIGSIDTLALGLVSKSLNFISQVKNSPFSKSLIHQHFQKRFQEIETTHMHFCEDFQRSEKSQLPINSLTSTNILPELVMSQLRANDWQAAVATIMSWENLGQQASALKATAILVADLGEFVDAIDIAHLIPNAGLSAVGAKADAFIEIALKQSTQSNLLDIKNTLECAKQALVEIPIEMTKEEINAQLVKVYARLGFVDDAKDLAASFEHPKKISEVEAIIEIAKAQAKTGDDLSARNILNSVTQNIETHMYQLEIQTSLSLISFCQMALGYIEDAERIMPALNGNITQYPSLIVEVENKSLLLKTALIADFNTKDFSHSEKLIRDIKEILSTFSQPEISKPIYKEISAAELLISKNS